MCTQNLKTLFPIEAEKSVTEIFIGEKEKWTNKWTDNQCVAVFLHNTTHHYPALYQISEFKSSCWDIFVRKKAHWTERKMNK